MNCVTSGELLDLAEPPSSLHFPGYIGMGASEQTLEGIASSAEAGATEVLVFEPGFDG